MANIKTKLAAEARAKAGKGAARATRRSGQVPAVIYGDNQEPIIISLPQKELNMEIEKGNFFTHLCDLTVEGKTHLVIPRDVQFHPVTDRPQHVDLLRVSAKTKISVDVPVHVTGEEKSKGIKEGGVLNLIHHTLSLYCPATSIPEEIVVDISALEMNDSIHIGELSLPKGIESDLPENITVLTVAPPTIAPVEEEVTDEIEMPEITGQKSEEDGDDGDDKAEGKSDEKSEGDKK